MPIVPFLPAIITAGATIYAGSQANRGAQQAAETQADAANQASQVQWNIYQQNRADMAPWRNMGVQALNTIGALYGFSSQGFGGGAPSGGGQPGSQTASSLMPFVTDGAGAGGGFGPGGGPPGGGAPSGPTQNWQGYLDANPDVMEEYNRLIATADRNSPWFTEHGLDRGPAGFAQWHYQNYGQAEGRQVPMTEPTGGGQGGGGGAPGQPVSDVNRFDAFFKSPEYNFRLTEGLNALDRSASARGGMESGGALKGVTRYAQGLASTEYGNWYNRLASLAGVGQTATSEMAGWGQNYANQFGNNIQNAAAARATGYQQQAANNSAMAGGLANVAGNIFSNWPGGGGVSPMPGPSNVWQPTPWINNAVPSPPGFTSQIPGMNVSFS